MTDDARCRTRSLQTRWSARLHRLLLVLLSAALLVLCLEPFALAPLAWIALVPLFLALRGASAGATRALCFLWGLAFHGLTVTWLVHIFGAAAAGLFAILAAGTWVFGLCFAALQQRHGYGRALLLTPILWVGVDLFRSELWYFRFSWAQLGLSQVTSPLILQALSVIGVYGLTLLIVAASAALAWTITHRGLRPGALAAGALLLVAVLLGAAPSPHPTIPPGSAAAAVQTEASDLDTSLALTAQAHADLIAWPEYSLMEYPRDDPQLLAKLQDAARRARATLIVGCKEHIPGADPDAFHNSALVLSPEGRVLGSYHKHYPVQFFHDGERGRGWPTFDTPLGRVGVAICYDMDFAPVFRRLVSRGAQLIVVPTYDALDWGERQHLQHSAMARARAVEVRRWVLRPTSSGVSQIIDPWGNVRESLPVGDEGVLVGEIQARSDRTVYVRGGWVLPYLCLALMLLLLTHGLVTRSRS